MLYSLNTDTVKVKGKIVPMLNLLSITPRRKKIADHSGRAV
jgi:hypothetical protein